MVKVGTADLKNHLSQYMRRVRKGESLLVTDRNEPIAKIVPIGKERPETADELFARLAGEGVVTYNPNAPPPTTHPKIRLKKGVSASETVIRMRRESRW